MIFPPLNGISKISRSTKNPGLISAEEAPSFNSVAATIRPSCAKETMWMVSSCMTSLQDPDPNITPNSSSLNMWTGKKMKKHNSCWTNFRKFSGIRNYKWDGSKVTLCHLGRRCRNPDWVFCCEWIWTSKRQATARSAFETRLIAICSITCQDICHWSNGVPMVTRKPQKLSLFTFLGGMFKCSKMSKWV